MLPVTPRVEDLALEWVLLFISVFAVGWLSRRRGNCHPNEKNEFLELAQRNYGYAAQPGGHIDTWRPRELPGLIGVSRRSKNVDEQQEVYLDYAGSALPVQSQLRRIAQLHETNLLANPHSEGLAAARTQRLVQQVRQTVLRHFDALPGRFAGFSSSSSEEAECHPGYELVFTSGSTEALRIVAEHFPMSDNGSGTLVYPQSVHTSVLGMRECFLQRGGSFVSKPLNELRDDVASRKDWGCRKDGHHLLVLPLECNFSGDRLCEDVLKDFRTNLSSSGNWSILLDVAKAASTGPVSLRRWNPDFACLSFYKLFGEPTGLGCLFVKRTAIPVLTSPSRERQYFGGGTVDMVLATADTVIRRGALVDALSHGTPHFRGIVSLLAGFEELDRVGGIVSIRRHAVSLARELVRRLRSLRHRETQNGVVVIYGDWAKYCHSELVETADIQDLPGPTVAFNIRRHDGTFAGYNEVSKLAALNRPPIQFRTGCFCNPGACQEALGLSNENITTNFETTGHVCGDQIDLIDGNPTGAIRVSFGKDSTWEDLDVLVRFVERIYVGVSTNKKGRTWDSVPRSVLLAELYIFPIKSAAAQRVTKWEMDRFNGKLLFDREFALVDSTGTAMRLQSYPKMTCLKPKIDLADRTLTITAPGRDPLLISLDVSPRLFERTESVVKVCGNKCGAVLWGDVEVSEWFSDFLGVQCWLARHSNGEYVRPSDDRKSDVAFANEQPLLLISEHAVDCINEVLSSQNQKLVTSRHFRPNIVVRLLSSPLSEPLHHAEDGWTKVEVMGKNIELDVAGECARCSMVDVDPSNGMRGKTLRALAEYRRSNGQITFGIFLRGGGQKQTNHDTRNQTTVSISEGDVLFCTYG